MNQAPAAICFTPGLSAEFKARQLAWQQLLGVKSLRYIPPWLLRYLPWFSHRLAATVVIDWGNKRQTIAGRYAQAAALPVLRLEDGFIRSISAGQRGKGYASASFSLVLDDLGIYYDACAPSRLECWLNGDATPLLAAQPSVKLALAISDTIDLDDPALLARARACIDQICCAHISKYNDTQDIQLPDNIVSQRYRLLLIDQLADDLSIDGGAANTATFALMLSTAMTRFPDADIIIKLDLAGPESHFDQALIDAAIQADPAFNGSIQLLPANYNVISLIKQVDEVYVVSSQVGFEALMLGKPVSCFGLPFYAGWGLTHDYQPIPRRRVKRTVEQVFAAVYLHYTHYCHPVTGKACELELLLDFFQRQRAIYRVNAGVNLCLGFPPWKRAYIQRFLASPWGETHFFRSEQAMDKYAQAIKLRSAEQQPNQTVRAVLWGGVGSTVASDSELPQRLQKRYGQLLRIEDGFIRSVGLGKYYIPPVSLVFDSQGIYFDPRTPSELESILARSDFSAQQLAAAKRLIQQLTSAGISKYNVGGSDLPKALVDAKLAATTSGKKIVLVPGQVENDASIQAACADINTNRHLLKQVRQRRPDAILVYKPHPDVVSGNAVNTSDTPGSGIESLADFTVTEVSIADCLAIADEVHTLTSLTGFEALIRDIDVFTYGLPFYAGWGLTEDYLDCPRRLRTLTTYQLTAALLLVYARYVDYRSGYFIDAEQALAAIIDTKQNSRDAKIAAVPSIYASKPQRLWLKAKNLLASWVYGCTAKGFFH